MNEIIIILIFSFIYSIFSTFLNIFVERKREVIKISREIEKFLKKRNFEKFYEKYFQLIGLTLKYTLLNIFIGFLIFLTLFSILKNFEMEIPYIGLKFTWFIFYAILVFIFSLFLKYLFRIFLKIWEKR